MDKINYNQHDWNKGEVIKEENLDNMENGIKQATDKINEIIDTEQDFKNRMADIDERIDINNEELVIARDGCDNLGQRIERDQQYIYNILNDGSYLEFNGTDITVDNSKEGYTKDTILKGQTYQNLIINANEIKNKTYTGNSTQQMYPYKVLRKANTVYTIIAYVSKNTLDNSFSFVSWGRTKDGMPVTIANGITGLIKKSFTTNDNVDEDYFIEVWSENTTGEITIDYMILLEGDWTDKEVPSEITGIESVGEKENNKISILSHGKNLFNMENLVTRGNAILLNRTSNSITIKTVKPWTGVEVSGFRVKPNTTYRVKFNPIDEKVRGYIRLRDNNGEFSGPVYAGGVNPFTFTTPANTTHVLFSIETTTPLENITISNIQIEEGADESVYEPYKQDKKEILIGLDGGLKSLPDGTCDTIEQRQDGVYLIQKIGKVVLNGSENWVKRNMAVENNTLGFGIHANDLNNYKSGGYGLSDKFIYESDPNVTWNTDIESMCNSDYMQLRIAKSKLSTPDVDGLKQWLQANPSTVYYELATAIETKLDLDTLNLETFKDVTYVTSGNSIKPTLSFKAPVDINQTIADLQGEQEQLIETYNTLKDENETVKMAISELNEQDDVQTADMLDLDMRVLALEEGLE